MPDGAIVAVNGQIQYHNKMFILEIIKKRRSIREFQKKEIPEKIIDHLIEALIWAPSAGNLQSRKFYFIFNQKTKDKLAEAALDQEFITQAPLLIVGCTNNEIQWKYGEIGKKLYSICDVSASIENMMLLATELGLGTCWVGTFEEKKVSKILNLPANLKPIVICPVGYSTERPSVPTRVRKKEAVQFLK